MQKLIAFSLSFLLLLSSTGITYAEHYCGSHKMMSVLTVGETALHCGMSPAPSSLCDEQLIVMDCCDNHYLSIETDDDYAKVSFEFQTVDFEFVPNLVFFDFTSQELVSPTITVPPYRPPPDQTPLFILYESYLI